METSQTDLKEREVTIVTGDPIVAVLAEMQLDQGGVMEMAHWIAKHRPECVPAGGFKVVTDLLPHDGLDEQQVMKHPSGDTITKSRVVTDNELLCELAGRKCYDSFAEKGAKRSNAEYLASMWTGRGVVHRSTGYHAKMTFFFADVSRRFSHEFIRNYVGSDRNEEGSPSQESTRFTHHPGVYICHPRDLRDEAGIKNFRSFAKKNYDGYCEYIRMEARAFKEETGADPKGMDRKRIYEAAAGLLLMSCSTSFIWTTNPMALMKFFVERCDEASDLEMQRFANTLKKICLARWPNLFPGVFPAPEAK